MRPQPFIISRRLKAWMQQESSGGIVMIGAALLALLLANSPFSETYFAAVAPASFWVKDVLMVLFFLAVGLELKREIKEGVLAKAEQVVLPLLCALGGMIVPALVFIGFVHDDASLMKGWAIPCATDIAFALVVLLLFGRSLGVAVRVFLLAVAIFDDLGAILIIALFYGGTLSAGPLLLALLGCAGLWGLNRRKVAHVTPYLLLGVFLWFCLHEGGLHTTLAGVLVGISIPMRDARRHSPLDGLLPRLHPWVSFGVLPIFAFASAGVRMVDMPLSSLMHPLPLGIMAGLFAGKQIGVFGVAFVLSRLRLLALPDGMGYSALYVASVLAGIGFTMSLFIGQLAFTDSSTREWVTIGVLGGSFLSALWGIIVMRLLRQKPQSGMM